MGVQPSAEGAPLLQQQQPASYRAIPACMHSPRKRLPNEPHAFTLGDIESNDVELDATHPQQLLHSISALWEKGYTSEVQLAKIQSKPLRDFYEAQNVLLEQFRHVAQHYPSQMSRRDIAFLREQGTLGDAECGGDAAQEEQIRRAVLSSNVCNLFLLFAQVFAFSSSGSLAVLATLVDASLDLVSGLVILFTWSMKRKRDKHRYPVGRTRLEPLGVIGMAVLMSAATLLTLEASVSTLLQGETAATFTGLTLPVGATIVTALFTKLMLYLYCRKIEDASVQALCEDHRNDLLSNSMSLVTVLLAQYALWWSDPLGGILISCLIIRNWVVHVLEHCDKLLGKAANRDIINVVTFMACTHSGVQLVDTVRAYHVGENVYVECDIVLPESLPLHEAHDIGESLQVRIEQVEGVERAYVHLDTEVLHNSSIEHKEL